jgi:hypothetical protein
MEPLPPGQDRSPPPSRDVFVASVLPERLVTALLLAGLQSPAGQQVWLGYCLARDDLPWLQTDRFRLTRCQATVERVPLVSPGEPGEGGVDGVALSTAGG